MPSIDDEDITGRPGAGFILWASLEPMIYAFDAKL